MTTRDTGQTFESIARAKLEQVGLKFIAANVSYRFGELDLIMRDGDLLVFVEVRYRRNSRFGGGLLSVTSAKQRRIALAASVWLADNPHQAQRACRFDVIAISGDELSPEINWVKAAFTLDDLG